MNNYFKIILSLIICLGAGIIGSLITVTGPGSWYQTLVKPPITPPNIVFPIVWTTLYILMGLSLYFIWTAPHKYRKDPEKRKSAITFFTLQLILNIAWSFLFFGLQNPVAGLVCIFALVGMTAITIIKFYQLSEKAAYLLVPYLIWLCFATVLNLWIIILN